MHSQLSPNANAHRLILRAELIHGGRTVVAHTVELSESSMFVRTDETASIGDRMLVRLSFPNLLAKIELEAHVVAKRLSTGPGEPAGLTLAYVFRTSEESDRLAELLALVRAGSPTEEVTATATPAAAPEYRALLVEDSALIRDMLLFGARKHFRNQKSVVKLDFAEDGESAWRKLQAGGYELVIVDFYLPGLSGAELVKRLRAAPDLKSMTVVAISVDAAKARDAFMAAGADIFLDKPLIIRDFFLTLEHLIASAHSEKVHP